MSVGKGIGRKERQDREKKREEKEKGEVRKGRRKIPVTPRLICSSAYLYIFHILFGVRAYTLARARVFVIPTCFCVYIKKRRQLAKAEGSEGVGERKKKRIVIRDHPETASIFLIRAFWLNEIFQSIFLTLLNFCYSQAFIAL